MSYDNPIYMNYCFGEQDFGNGDESLSIKGPSGMSGVIKDICVSASETFTNDTTEAFVQLGTASDIDAFAKMGLGTLADTNSVTATEASGDIIDKKIPADTQVEVTFTAPTGGTPAGKGYVAICIGWA